MSSFARFLVVGESVACVATASAQASPGTTTRVVVNFPVGETNGLRVRAVLATGAEGVVTLGLDEVAAS